MTDLTAVSLFAGIGGIDLALRQSGIDVVAAVEIDADCQGVLRRHFPETQLFGDIAEVTGDRLLAAGFVPGRGILAGGSPCQDFSVAGRRAGLGGARSGLFWHITRLADELRPRWLLFENVPGMLSSVCSCPGEDVCAGNGRAVRCGEWRTERDSGPGDELAGDDCFVCGHGWDVHDAGGFCAFCSDTCEGLPEVRFRKVFVPGVPHAVAGGACPGGCMRAHGGAMGTVLGALGKRWDGIAYRILDAQFFGVPQRRSRVFIVGCAGDRAAPVEVLLEPESSAGHPPPGRAAGKGAAAGAPGGAGDARTVGTLGGSGPGGGWRVGADEAAAGQLVAGTLGSRQGGARTTDLDGHGAYPLLEVNGRAGPGEDVKTGTGIGAPDDPMFTLQAGKQHGIATPLDLRNAARSTVAGDTAGTGVGVEGDPSFTLSATLRGMPGVAAPLTTRPYADETAQESKLIAATLQGGGKRGHRIDAEGAAGGHLIPFDTAQITSGENRSNPRPGDPAPTLNGNGLVHVAPLPLSVGADEPAYALTSRASRASRASREETYVITPDTSAAITAHHGKGPDSDATNGLILAPPLAATLTSGTHGEGVSAPGRHDEDQFNLVATPLALRGRADGSNIEMGEPGDPAFALRTPGGGSSHPMLAHALTSEGADASEDGTGRGTPLVPYAPVPSSLAGKPRAFNPQTGGSAARLGYGETPTALSASQVHAVHLAGAERGQEQEAGLAVRRLTPRECERLQGLPDDWTRWKLINGELVEQSDSARYREVGNSVAVPVVQWITARLAAVDAARSGAGEAGAA